VTDGIEPEGPGFGATTGWASRPTRGYSMLELREGRPRQDLMECSRILTDAAEVLRHELRDRLDRLDRQQRSRHDVSVMTSNTPPPGYQVQEREFEESYEWCWWRSDDPPEDEFRGRRRSDLPQLDRRTVDPRRLGRDPSHSAALLDAWAHYTEHKRHNDPPGIDVACGPDGFTGCPDGVRWESLADARAAAWAWYERRVALAACCLTWSDQLVAEVERLVEPGAVATEDELKKAMA